MVELLVFFLMTALIVGLIVLFFLALYSIPFTIVFVIHWLWKRFKREKPV